MSRLIFDDIRARQASAGVSHGVLYSSSDVPSVWNGLTKVTEIYPERYSAEGYIDGQKYYSRRADGAFSGEVTAFTYPDTLNAQEEFNFTYRTGIQRGALGEGSYIHLVYNALFTPTGTEYDVSTDISDFTWNFTTTAMAIPGARPSSHLILSSVGAYSSSIKDLEDILYGTDTTQPEFPTPQEVIDLVEDNSLLKIIDHGDGTWTAIGSDTIIKMLAVDEFQITWPSAVYIDADTYSIRSL